MQDDIAFAPPAETLTTDERLAELAAILAGGFAYGMRSWGRTGQPGEQAKLLPPTKALLAAQTYSLARGVRAWPVQVKTPRGPVWAVRTADGFVPREELRLLTVKEN